MNFIVMCLLVDNELATIFLPNIITSKQSKYMDTVGKNLSSYHISLTNSDISLRTFLMK